MRQEVEFVKIYPPSVRRIEGSSLEPVDFPASIVEFHGVRGGVKWHHPRIRGCSCQRNYIRKRPAKLIFEAFDKAVEFSLTITNRLFISIAYGFINRSSISIGVKCKLKQWLLTGDGNSIYSATSTHHISRSFKDLSLNDAVDSAIFYFFIGEQLAFLVFQTVFDRWWTYGYRRILLSSASLAWFATIVYQHLFVGVLNLSDSFCSELVRTPDSDRRSMANRVSRLATELLRKSNWK